MNAIETLLMASYFDRQVKQGSFEKSAIGAMDIANAGSYFLPGVGTARLGIDAFNDFRGGNYLGGAANLLGAGLSLIPFGGGMIGRGIGMGGRMLGGALRSAGAPTLGAATRLGGRQLGKGVSWLRTGLGPAIGRGMQNVASRHLPNFGGQAMSRQMGNLGSGMIKHPWLTSAVGIGAHTGLSSAGEGMMEGKQMMAQQQQGMGNMMKMLRQRPVMNNPMYAGGGRNPNYM